MENLYIDGDSKLAALVCGWRVNTPTRLANDWQLRKNKSLLTVVQYPSYFHLLKVSPLRSPRDSRKKKSVKLTICFFISFPFFSFFPKFYAPILENPVLYCTTRVTLFILAIKGGVWWVPFPIIYHLLEIPCLVNVNVNVDSRGSLSRTRWWTTVHIQAQQSNGWIHFIHLLTLFCNPDSPTFNFPSPIISGAFLKNHFSQLNFSFSRFLSFTITQWSAAIWDPRPNVSHDAWLNVLRRFHGTSFLYNIIHGVFTYPHNRWRARITYSSMCGVQAAAPWFSGTGSMCRRGQRRHCHLWFGSTRLDNYIS